MTTIHKMGWCFDCERNDCEHVENATKSLIQSLTEKETFIKNGKIIPADDVSPDQPPYYGGNKIPASYLKAMDERYYARVGKRPEPMPDEMSFDLKCFVSRL